MLTLEQVKDYLSIDRDYDGDDAMLLQMMNTTANGIEAYADTSVFEEYNPNLVDSSNALPPRAEQIQLMLIAELYNNREMQTPTNMTSSPVFKFLFDTIIKYKSF